MTRCVDIALTVRGLVKRVEASLTGELLEEKGKNDNDYLCGVKWSNITMGGSKPDNFNPKTTQIALQRLSNHAKEKFPGENYEISTRFYNV